MSSVLALPNGRVLATYDGRSSAAQNWEEVTGTAEGRLGSDGLIGPLIPSDEPPLRSPNGPGGLRYLSVLPLDERRTRIYYEVTRPDGAHELHAELLCDELPEMPDAVAS